MAADKAPARVVLVGGGHAHVEVLRRAAMRRMPDTDLVLVTDRVHSAYSGMVPALISGEIEREELEIDVWPLARRAGATVIIARMTGIDPITRRVHLKDRPSLHYDLCSLDIGGSVAGLDTPGVREHAVATRPLAVLLQRLGTLSDTDAKAITVVGAGAAGVELALALRHRVPSAEVTLWDRGRRVVDGGSGALRRRTRSALAEHRVSVRTNVRVLRVNADSVECSDGAALASDLTVWATGAAPHPVLVDAGLPTGPRGFVRIEDDLRVVGHSRLFAVGDCAVPDSRPDLPRAGVYAVRMGPVLHNNLVAVLNGRPTEPYRPQRSMLSLLNVSDGTAIGAKYGVAIRSAWMARLKDRIDRGWLDRYRGDGLPDMPPMPMVCSGCAAKAPSGVLEAVLAGRVHGTVGEDAAHVAIPGPLAWTVDAFPAFTKDTWLASRVAAGHALADLWCKGVRPTHALALVTAPAGDPEALQADLQAAQRGLTEVLDEHGIALVGGHTMTGPDVAMGLTALGPAPRFLGIDGASVGDRLLLTRPLGTGVALRSDAMGHLAGHEMQAVYDSMLGVDAGVVEVADKVSAATDVSGFGLANHLLDLCRASDVACEVEMDDLPALPGVIEALDRGIRSTSAPDNEAAAQQDLDIAPHRHRPLLFDPQTGGGVLVCVPASELEAVQARLGGVCIDSLVPYDGGARVRASTRFSS